MLVIDSHSPMRGTVLAAGQIRLDGWFDGELICSELIVGTDGYLLGTVTTRRLVVDGQIVGRAFTGSARLNSGAFFEGDLYHTSLTKNANATLIGEAISTRGLLKLPADLVALEQKARSAVAGAVPLPTSEAQPVADGSHHVAASPPAPRVLGSYSASSVRRLV